MPKIYWAKSEPRSDPDSSSTLFPLTPTLEQGKEKEGGI